MGISIIIPVFNKLDITEQCLDHIRKCNGEGVYEIIIVDNGSTDGTRQFFSSPPVREREGGAVRYIRSDENLGVARACNRGAEAAQYEILCFMHNDVFVLEDNWVVTLSDFIAKTAYAGVVGLYGAKTIRKDGSFRGKTIIHAIKDNPAITGRYEKAAVIDGLLLAMTKKVFDKIRGFCDGFIVHFYDKDISMRAYKAGFINYVINIPFEHACAATRSEVPQEDVIRDEARENFMEIWSPYLPLDVSTWQDKISSAIKRKKGH